MACHEAPVEVRRTHEAHTVPGDLVHVKLAPRSHRSLQNAMKWDEDRFGLEYDLDIYNIVAVKACWDHELFFGKLIARWGFSQNQGPLQLDGHPLVSISHSTFPV